MVSDLVTLQVFFCRRLGYPLRTNSQLNTFFAVVFGRNIRAVDQPKLKHIETIGTNIFKFSRLSAKLKDPKLMLAELGTWIKYLMVGPCKRVPETASGLTLRNMHNPCIDLLIIIDWSIIAILFLWAEITLSRLSGWSTLSGSPSSRIWKASGEAICFIWSDEGKPHLLPGRTQSHLEAHVVRDASIALCYVC